MSETIALATTITHSEAHGETGDSNIARERYNEIAIDYNSCAKRQQDVFRPTMYYMLADVLKKQATSASAAVGCSSAVGSSLSTSADAPTLGAGGVVTLDSAATRATGASGAGAMTDSVTAHASSSKDPEVRILDLACGDGWMTFHAATNCGDKAIVYGVDVSEKMVECAEILARKDHPELAAAGRIRFIAADAGSPAMLDTLGVSAHSFDVVTAVFFLNYARSKDELKQMFRTVALCLRPGGYFIGLNNNPRNVPSVSGDLALCGNDRIFPPDIKEGQAYVTRVGSPDCHVSFENVWWKDESYQEAAREAGFECFEWVPLLDVGEPKWGRHCYDGTASSFRARYQPTATSV